MLFNETELAGAFVIELELLEDQRGFFARAWSGAEFQARGLKSSFAQCNISGSKQRGTIRGLHYQAPPYAEAKLITCTKGAIHDVIVDLRLESPTRLQWVGVELTAQNRKMLYVPEGFAHGFQALCDDVEMLYCHSIAYHPQSEDGLNPSDSRLAIEWPLAISEMSNRDRELSFVDDNFSGLRPNEM